MWQTNIIFLMPIFWFWGCWFSNMPYIKPADLWLGTQREINARMKKMVEDCKKRTAAVPVMASVPWLASVYFTVINN